jgi:hypothetical protein
VGRAGGLIMGLFHVEQGPQRPAAGGPARLGT